MSLQTQVYTVHPDAPEARTIKRAADVIRAGQLVAFPTETVYGLGANALDPAAIDRIYEAKQRPASDPLIVHIHQLEQLKQIAADVPDVVERLAERFWPGPLTFVLKRAPGMPSNIAAGLDTVAVRMPAHPVAMALLMASGVPIAAPSANTFTRPSATTAQHVLEDLDGRVDVVLDGGPTTIGLESTVLDLTVEQPVILRPGGVLLADLRKILHDAVLRPGYVEDEASVSPGQSKKHYSPRAKMTVYTGPRVMVLEKMRNSAAELTAQGHKVGILIADDEGQGFPPEAIVITLGSGLVAISKTLFAAMRQLDELGADVILTRDFGRDGLGTALWDRLTRASEGNIVQIE